jgi:hypothetical protein
VPALLARSETEYSRILSRLLGDADAYARACTATRRLADAYPTAQSFGRDLAAAIDKARRLSRGGWSAWRVLDRLGRIVTLR